MEIDKGSLEELLIANWTRFMDPRQTLTMLQETVREHRHELASCQSVQEMKPTQMTISRFQLVHGGFTIWLDFVNIQTDGGHATGTSEFRLTWTGGLQHVRTVGSLCN